ncbi:MAG: 30S ribosomal protein S4 [Lentisphaeria bacterium]|nr:30S ribosomal protein S4 [Lentisphaeria bacterium]
MATTKNGTHGAKHTLCRRIGFCLWGQPNCPTNSRVIKTREGADATSTPKAYPAGQHGPTKRRVKLSTYGQLLLEKQKLKTFYDLTEHQLTFIYRNSKRGLGNTGDKLLANLEMRLVSAVYRSGLAPTIFAARQVVSHRHILVNGKICDRASLRLKAGDVLTIDEQHSPMIAKIAKESTVVLPPYMEKDAASCKVTITREPLPEEIHVDVSIIKVIEYYNLH